MKINKINLLIHPGFLSSPDSSPDFISNAKRILPKYIEKARSMQDDEVMIAFCHGDAEKTAEHFRENEAYIQTILAIRKILNRRFIVLFEDGNYEDIDSHRIREIIAARGFHMDATVETEAGGEVLGACVEAWASSFNLELELEKPTIINTYYTDCGTVGDSTRTQFFDKQVEELRTEYPRLDWI